jgi:uncharacterized membrane-anchored protein
MTGSLKIAGLAVVCAAQLGAAAWSIVRYESTLRSGALYLIRTAPADPSDAFRGRYVAVRPAILVPTPLSPETDQLLQRIQAGETGFATLATDPQGFARASGILLQPPAQGDYLKIRYVWPQFNPDPLANRPALSGYNVEFSFDRYYMNEAAAPAAEQRYAEATRRNTSSRAWLAVRVKDGAGVIERLFIDGVPIEKIAAPK